MQIHLERLLYKLWINQTLVGMPPLLKIILRIMSRFETFEHHLTSYQSIETSTHYKYNYDLYYFLVLSID
jgi:hypothetical protein